ncbi:Bug family tripartite tricarboxylate transporter substrate binding protein [Sabulicella glaciei]|uniref:Tripartite tricarboxylate transporter substrate binding protein n=1 Tax=Sabulicella glaciei TaxID=2984948 RepID=A0ABT3NY13_9PROT|nr:tripartite tricarboxylate transporter substrate binding protein [Roseococcus sp. MDT2-1-1]MCW8086454.1 tripartite tricarboxylate transporter substrate binding protein [Roseococcus sp. MDT2-1-1]
MKRRTLLALPALLPATASAQSFGSRPIRVIVPFAAGGAADSATRALTPGLSQRLGATIVVENRTGAGGSLGGNEVARAAPDGHTLLMDASSHLVNPALLRGLAFEYATAFAPISLAVTFPQVLAVKNDLPARDLREFIALARRQTMNIGTQGNATAGHLGLVQFARAAGIELTHVPYRGGADAARDLAAGTLDGAFITMLSAGPIVDSGRARFLAVSAPQRVSLRPDVHTFAEAGTPGIELSEWCALFAPAGTPPALVTQIHGALAATLAEADVQRRLAQLAAVPVGSDPATFARFVAEGRTAMATLVREANIRID